MTNQLNEYEHKLIIKALLNYLAAPANHSNNIVAERLEVINLIRKLEAFK